uniref:PI3K/PI4K domain-containing protein n=1 Tax=Caenorhabditis tropicalis TaxID=1561998 RepID=A0A1I7TIC9_9PELO
MANDYIKVLDDSKFFIVYAGLIGNLFTIQKTLYERYDKKSETIKNTIETFFEELLMGKKPKFSFDKKTEGTRTGIICTIEHQDTVKRYYVKTHHDAGRSVNALQEGLDIRELFVYRLLERLGVGATIQFPTSTVGSKCFMYIAGLQIPNFKTLDEVEREEDDYAHYVHPAIQMLTLFAVLSIGDRHSKNVGVGNDKSPFIIDFCMNNLEVRDLDRDFVLRIRHSNKINNLIDEYSFKECVDIAVDFLKKIGFEKKTDEAVQYFIENDKKAFEENNLHFSQDITDDLKQYIQVVKQNLNKFFAYSN